MGFDARRRGSESWVRVAWTQSKIFESKVKRVQYRSVAARVFLRGRRAPCTYEHVAVAVVERTVILLDLRDDCAPVAPVVEQAGERETVLASVGLLKAI